MNHSFGVGRSQPFGNSARDAQCQRHIERLWHVVEKSPQVRPVNEFHGKEESPIFGRLQVSSIHHILVSNLPQSTDLAQKSASEGLVLAQLIRQEFEGLRLIHQRMMGEINGTHTTLTKLTDNAVTLVNYHARLEVANLVQLHAVGRTGNMAIGVAGIALWALFHAFTLLFTRFRGASIVPLDASKRKDPLRNQPNFPPKNPSTAFCHISG